MIGKNQITLTSENKPQAPEIRNWLRSYNQIARSMLGSLTLRQSQYFSTNKDYLKLSPADKNILVAVIKLYDFIQAPGQVGETITPETELPPVGKAARIANKSQSTVKKIFDETNVQNNESAINGNEKHSQIREEVLMAYQGDPKQQKAILSELENIKNKIGTDVAKIRSEFYIAVQKKNVVRTVAILRVMAESGDIPNFMKEDQKLQKFLSAVWEKRYGRDFIASFASNPAQVQFVRLFLRYILEERLGMVENEAARVGLQIGNIFVNLGKKSYNKVAYFDIKDKSFRWFE